MDLRALLMGLSFALIWSSAFTSARMIVTAAPPLTALSLRFLLSGLAAVAIARMLGQSWRISGGQARAVVLFGLCQNALYLGFNFVAMQRIEASLAAIIASTMPLMVAGLGWAFFRERIRWTGLAGLVAGLGGVALIMGARLSGGVADPVSVGLCCAGSLALALATLTLRGASSGGNLLMIVGLQMLVGSVALALPAVILEQWEILWSWQLVLAFLYTTFVPGLGATLLWFVLVRRVGAVRAATYHFLNPFFGVAIAALLLAEPLRPGDLVGVVIIMAGILAVQMARMPPATR